LIPLLLSLAAGPALASTSAATTAVDHAVRMTGGRMTSALNLLEAKGYASFTGFKPDGDHYVATVTEGNRQFAVSIDPDSGQVMPQA
jgi:hypothetical protein